MTIRIAPVICSWMFFHAWIDFLHMNLIFFIAKAVIFNNSQPCRNLSICVDP